MNSLPVIAVSTASLEPTFDSFEEAVHAGSHSSREQRARSDLEGLRGKRVISVDLQDARLVLGLESANWLDIHCQHGRVEWSICEHAPTGTGPRTLPSALILDWGGEVGEREWDRAELATALAGRPISHLAATSTWLFLKVSGEPQYMFAHLLTDGEHKLVLHFDHDPE